MNSKYRLLVSAYLSAASLALSLSAGASGAETGKTHPQKTKIDLAFCIDTTGSMANEIETVKTKTKEIVAKLGGSKPAPDIRVGVVAYRDRGDEYVTKLFQFTSDIDQVVKDISSLSADGGGDTPEAVNQALHASVNDLSWSKDKKAVKILFLIGDAGPHVYPGDYNWETESKNAIARGIQINTIACDMTNGTGQNLEVFQKIAKLADGKCELLTCKQEIADASGRHKTIVASGGRMFEVSREASSAWRDGADKLMAKGMATPMAASASGLSAAPAGLAGAYSASGAVSDFRSVVNAPSRTDSNLAEIVISATREAARKKAKLD